VAKAGESCQLWLGRLIGPRHMVLKLVVVALVALIAASATVKDDFRLSSTAVLEPEVRRAAVAPFNGYVAEAQARAGDLVKKGQLLCSLDDRDMRLERLKALSQQEQLTKQYHLAMAKREAAQTNILAAQIDQAKAQLTLLEEQLSRTRILAPFDGVIVQGDLSQALGSPVERGQVLFEVAPLEAYRLILHVDERDIAYATVGQRGQLLLAAAPESPQPFVVSKITPISTAREGRNYFRVEATLDETPDSLRPGMEGVGKIAVGRELFVWIWMRQAIDWVRLTLWQWMP
jgi:multidrug resistance efflux pump